MTTVNKIAASLFALQVFVMLGYTAFQVHDFTKGENHSATLTLTNFIHLFCASVLAHEAHKLARQKVTLLNSLAYKLNTYCVLFLIIWEFKSSRLLFYSGNWRDWNEINQFIFFCIGIIAMFSWMANKAWNLRGEGGYTPHYTIFFATVSGCSKGMVSIAQIIMIVSLDNAKEISYINMHGWVFISCLQLFQTQIAYGETGSTNKELLMLRRSQAFVAVSAVGLLITWMIYL